MAAEMSANLDKIQSGDAALEPLRLPAAPKGVRRGPMKHGPLLVCLYLLFGNLSFSFEKYSIAEDSELVVVGRLTNFSSVRRDGGWLFTGTIVAEEILFGPVTAPRNLAYRFACSCCPSLRQPPMQALARERGLWFLTLIRGSEAWESAGSCSDPGFRPIVALEEMRRFLRSRGSDKSR